MKTGIYIVSTPIGNHKDITTHALEVLRSAGIILCEDTRKTNFLLQQYEITNKKLFILNEHSTEAEINRYLNFAKESSVALVSDAGTPLICDPGYEIANKARTRNIAITVVTGACALIAAATLCGLNINNMLFLGFFKKGIKFDTTYLNALYVAPHDVLDLIKNLYTLEAKHELIITIAREVTKEFEEVLSFTSTKFALEHFVQNEPRGEFTVFVSFKQKAVSAATEVLHILNELEGWKLLQKKALARFLHKNFLHNISQKEIYEVLHKI